MRRVLALVLPLVLTTCWLAFGQDHQDSGGPLHPLQAAYDVLHYDLALELFPDREEIAGTLTATAAVTAPLDTFLLDLDHRLTTEQVEVGGEGAAFAQHGNRLFVALPEPAQPGDTLSVAVTYGGAPRVAPTPPWDGGFTWAETPAGAPWIATSVQGEGADLWWPTKDHPSDEPDSMDLHIRVPQGLVVAANGRLRSIEEDGAHSTYHWHVSTPINNYGVALNVAPYETVQTTYQSTAGEVIPVTFYVLPSSLEDAREHLPAFLDHVRYLEETLGPYPFRADKYAIAHTPHLGMEHQSIIAYGNEFGNHGVFGFDQGFDALHFHELAHEWYANLVTASDWKDFWIHEGTASYMGALYAEELNGLPGYWDVIANQRAGMEGGVPIAYRTSMSEADAYHGDIYTKGALVWHTYRHLVGKEEMIETLRRIAYPDPAMEAITDGSHTRLVDTDEIVAIAEEVTGRELDWFFDAYLYEAELPRLIIEEEGGALHLAWDVPGDVERFPMPVPVVLGSDTLRVDVPPGGATLRVPDGAEVAVDPEGWVLKDLVTD